MLKKIYLLIFIIFIYSSIFSMDYISSPLISGYYNDIVVKDDIAYVANDWGLMIFDVTDKENPQLINKLPLDIGTQKVSIFENLLFIGGSTSSEIYDISDQINPFHLSNIPIYSRDFKVYNNYLFTSSYGSSIFNLGIFDIENIENPTEISIIDSVFSFDMKNEYLYTVFCSPDNLPVILKVYNIADIEAPILLNEIRLTDNYNGKYPYILVNNNVLYCVCYNYLHTIDIENPGEPEVLNILECETCFGENKFTINNSYLYLREGEIIDVSGPEIPQLVGNYAPDWPPYNEIMGIAISDDYFYVANGEFGFYIMDLSNPVEPEQTSWYVNRNFYFGIYKDENFAYVASMNGLIILDVSDPENGVEIGNCYTGWSNDVLVENNYAYVTSDVGFIILNVSDPENPYVIDDYSFSCDKLIKENNLVYALNDASAVIKIFDVSNPHNIQFLGSCDLKFHALDLYLKDNYLYVAGGYAETAPAGYDPGGLKIVDVTDPSDPQWINSINPDSTRFFRSIQIKDTYVFMGSNEPGIYVFDVSNPLSPFVHSYIEVEQETGICDMEIQGEYLYTTSLRGKYIFDISEINSIELVDFYPDGESNNCWSISVDGNYIYEASTYSVNIYFSSIVGVEEFEQNLIYKKMILNQNFPNPFKSTTVIRYGIPRNLWKIPISLNIYNIRGQLVKTFDQDTIKKGTTNEITWNCKGDNGKTLCNGIYFYKLTADKKEVVKKMILMR